MSLINTDQNYNDHNYYLRFISSQIKWRKTMRDRGHFNNLCPEQKLYQFSIVNATGLRASGATTAISHLFNPKKDLYIGCNDMMCQEFKKAIFEREKRLESNYDERQYKMSYLNFKSVNFDNTNIDSKVIEDKIEEFFDNENLEIMAIKSQFNPYGKSKKQIVQIDIEDIKKDIAESLLYGHEKHDYNSNNFTDKFVSSNLIHMRRGISDIIVYIDVGAYNHREYSVRVNRLIKYIYSKFPCALDLMFVLT